MNKMSGIDIEPSPIGNAYFIRFMKTRIRNKKRIRKKTYQMLGIRFMLLADEFFSVSRRFFPIIGEFLDGFF